MKKRPNPASSPSAFSIARQFTGPPFSVTLESADLRRNLMEEILEPGPAGPAPAKRRSKKAKK